tara:strand:+ start:471 stop:1037 length:567 start_codon:yes stop_codon:yes gene_type:complete
MMSNTKNFYDLWKSFLVESQTNDAGLSERDFGLGRLFSPGAQDSANDDNRQLRQAPKVQDDEEERQVIKGKGKFTKDYRGTDPQIFTGPMSVAQALIDLELPRDLINNILDAMKKDFEFHGFEILEKKGKEVINLDNTIRVLTGASLPAEDKKKINNLITNFLRLHKVRLRNDQGIQLNNWATGAPTP